MLSMIGGAYPFIILFKPQSIIPPNSFVKFLSQKLHTLSPRGIRIDPACILLMRSLAFLKENIQIKGQ